MKPVIALVGRPNVGKSTLFNQITRSRDALVANFSGLTRDRKYGAARHDDVSFIVIDTGGISGEEEGIDAAMAQQSLLAIDEADEVLFLVDARAGLTPADQHIAQHLRRTGKVAHLVVNKTDGLDAEQAAAEFHQLGMSSSFHIAASHNRGIRAMLDVLAGNWREAETGDAAPESQGGVRIGIIGRPNVGKSTLVNRLLGEERVIVFDLPGTTRDSIEIPYERHGKPYTLIDTAGVRRRKSVKETVEKFSIVKTLQAITDANVIVMVLDAREGLVDQDLHLIGYALDAGRALIIAVNKWDGMAPEDRQKVKEQLKRRLTFLDYAPVHQISALHGTGVGDLYASIDQCYASSMAKWSTNQLTQLLQDATAQHQPPLVQGRRIKLRYAHQGGSNPPIIVVHGNQTSSVPDIYKRYLENIFRKVLKVVGTPIRFEFKSGENPFADRKSPPAARKGEKTDKRPSHFDKYSKRGAKTSRRKVK